MVHIYGRIWPRWPYPVLDRILQSAIGMANESELALLPLSEDEAALMCHITRWGSSGYPIQRVGRRWHWIDCLGVRGSPISYRTKKAATEAFEGWYALALERWKEFKCRHPTAIMTGQGVKILP